MLIKKTDIGGEIISILTKGMYLDPKDALREYVQNGVDADATDISIKIRQDTIVVIDNGIGMDKETMRRAIRVGISDKNLSKNVGFMGIGIYSSFHLCDKLYIYSKKDNELPNLLTFNFKLMRDELESQRELRYSSNFDNIKLVALQDLLEKNIELNVLEKDEFPKKGTRVEMTGVEPTFYKSLSQFKEVSNYLEQVVPVPFHPEFIYGKEIHNYVRQVCINHDQHFSLINLELQINEERELLFRPYTNDLFDPSPLEPEFIILKSKGEFFGIAWGCLNSSKNTIKSSTRGFIVKKQGFTIGDRNDLLPYFGRQTYYNRYIGEVIVVHSKLLPNASRSEFEYSPLRIEFQDTLKNMANEFNKFADTHQEELKAKELLNKSITFLKENKAQFEYNTDNLDKLLELSWHSKEYSKVLKNRKSKHRFKSDDLNKADEVVKQLDAFAKEIREVIEIKKKKKRRKHRKTESEIASEVENIPETSDSTPEVEYVSLLNLIESLGLSVNNELSTIIELIDENFIRASAEDKDDYLKNLIKLKNDFEELMND